MPTDHERLEYLLSWLDHNEDVRKLPVRDWNDHEDARVALDAAIRGRRKRCRWVHEDGQQCSYWEGHGDCHLASDGTLQGTWKGPARKPLGGFSSEGKA